MNSFKMPAALLGFFAIVMVIPPWVWFVYTYSSNLSAEGVFIATLILPALIFLYIASWVQPRSS